MNDKHIYRCRTDIYRWLFQVAKEQPTIQFTGKLSFSIVGVQLSPGENQEPDCIVSLVKELGLGFNMGWKEYTAFWWRL